RAMISANPIILYPSKIKLIVRSIVFGLLFTPPLIGSFTLFLAGCYLSWAASLVLGVVLATSIMWTFILITTTLDLIRDVPRLEIGPHGFVLHQLACSSSRRWNDIEGDFVVRVTPLGRAVVYRLTEAFRKSQEGVAQAKKVGTKELMFNTFPMSPGKLAELLNEHKRRAIGSVATGVP